MANVWYPQVGPQLAALEADWAFELFYGGARGGGKTSFVLGDNQDAAMRYGAGWKSVIFRQSYPQLEEVQAQAYQIFPATGATFHAQASGSYPISNCWYWPNGATVRMRYIEQPSDADEYQGHQYTGVYFDELPLFPNDVAYRKLLACLRSSDGVPTRIRSTGNPGGPGHHWVKARFIDPDPLGYTPIDTPLGVRVFIPAKVWDNKILMQSDPTYADRLRDVGSESLVRAWLDGDWSVIQGAFFPEFHPAKHIIKHRPLPKHWTRFRAMDWGSAKPFSVGWYAISDGELSDIPRGCIVKYREWYGMRSPNVGLKLPADTVARGILEREVGDTIADTLSVADPHIFAEDGGPSIGERMFIAGCKWRKADNRRIGGLGALGGWDQLRARLRGDEEGRPMILFMDNCKDTIRTLPALQHDEARPEDCDSDGEDHACDETRYACMARPWINDVPIDDATRRAKEFAELVKPVTFDQLVAETPVSRLRERI